MTRRKGISSTRRFRILRRDDFRCRYCGLRASTTHLEVDHVIPVSRGGTDNDSNLATSCQLCNHGKAATLLGTSTTVDSIEMEHAELSFLYSDPFVTSLYGEPVV